jgi:hypothetical protein
MTTVQQSRDADSEVPRLTPAAAAAMTVAAALTAAVLTETAPGAVAVRVPGQDRQDPCAP